MLDPCGACDTPQAVINTNGRHVHLGTFVDEDEAALVFDKCVAGPPGLEAETDDAQATRQPPTMTPPWMTATHESSAFTPAPALLSLTCRAAIICRGTQAKLNFRIANYTRPDGTLIHDREVRAHPPCCR